MLRQLIRERQTNKTNVNDKAIEIFNKYFILQQKLDEVLFQERITTRETDRFQYVHVFQAEIGFIKAISQYLNGGLGKLAKNFSGNDYCNVFHLNLYALKSDIALEKEL